jgi:chemotaxis methyl-accepting protein methylase
MNDGNAGRHPDMASMPTMTLVESSVDTVIPRLAAAINRRIGFRSADVMSKIASCLALVDTSDRSAYAQRLTISPPGDVAWNAFIELMLVHETYFFRHPAQIELLCDEVLPRLDAERRQAGRATLTAWTAGCSTGEEAWTMALTAAYARGAGNGGVTVPLLVLGTDISEPALAVARAGSYARSHALDSFRAIPPWAVRHFAGLSEGNVWSVPAGLRRDVRFQCHNLLDAPPIAGADLVLCRNTLIYFDEAANRRAQVNLAAALRPGGVLVLGPADTLREPKAFAPVEAPGATVYRKLA